MRARIGSGRFAASAWANASAARIFLALLRKNLTQMVADSAVLID